MKLAVGEVLHDPSFVFRDGETGNKLLVVLAVDEAICLVARTTSQPLRKSRSYGCHHEDAQPNFYLPLEAGIFPKDTWLCLDYLTELQAAALQKSLDAGRIKRRSRLTPGVLREILNCAGEAEDTSQAQAAMIRVSLRSSGD